MSNKDKYAVYQQAVEQKVEQDFLDTNSLDAPTSMEAEASLLLEKAKQLQEQSKENPPMADNNSNALDLDAFNAEFPVLDSESDNDFDDDLDDNFDNDLNFEENFIDDSYDNDEESVKLLSTEDGKEVLFYQSRRDITEANSANEAEKADEILQPWQELEQGVKAWVDFNSREQESIVRHYAPKIRFIASRMKAKLPKHIELSELISAGTLGLLESLGKFKPQFAIRFDTYAESRIRGAMIDELRRLDWFPRSLRSKVREINQAVWKIESEHGRTPSVEEIAELTGLSEKNVSAGLEALQNQLCVPLESIQDYIASDGGANNEEDPYKNTAFGQLVDKVAGMIDILTPREKLVLSLYYTDELSMREVSEVMDITEGRVSQLHTQAIARLRRVFEGQYQDSL